MAAVLEAENVTLAFIDQIGRFMPQNAQKYIKGGYLFKLFYTSKWPQKYIKGGYLFPLLGFEVTEWIYGMEAVLEAEM